MIRTAVIGVGHQGRWHADKMAALEKSSLVAVADHDAERAREVASDLGVEAAGSYRDLVGNIDAAVVSTPTPSHHEIIGTLLDAGIHVLAEKPITVTVDEARELVELAEAKGLVLQVGHLERFNPAIAVVAPHISEPQFIESNRIAPYKPRGVDVSVVLDLMIHDIDLIHSFARSPMKNVDAAGRAIISESTDIANARIRFANGCIANVTSSRLSTKTERSLRIFQPNAYFSVDLYAKNFSMYRKKTSGPLKSLDDIEYAKQEFESSDALLEQSRAFLESVSGGPPPLVSGRIAMEALETAAAIGEMVNAN